MILSKFSYCRAINVKDLTTIRGEQSQVRKHSITHGAAFVVVVVVVVVVVRGAWSGFLSKWSSLHVLHLRGRNDSEYSVFGILEVHPKKHALDWSFS